MIAVVIVSQRDLNSQQNAERWVKLGARFRRFVHRDRIQRLTIIALHLKRDRQRAPRFGQKFRLISRFTEQ